MTLKKQTVQDRSEQRQQRRKNRRVLAAVLSGCLLAAIGGTLYWQLRPVQAAPLGNLVGYWKLDEPAAGSTAVDSSGSGNNAAPVNNPVPTTDVPSELGTAFADPYSASFNGTDQYFTAPDSGSLDSTAGVSVSVWVKFNNVSGNQTIAGKWSVGAQQQWVLQLNSDGYFGWWTGNGGNGGDDLESTTKPTTGVWYNIVATDNGTTKTLYINGTPQSSDSNGTLGVASGVPVTLGGKNNGSGTYFEFLNGSLDDVRVYSRALSATEAGELAQGNETTATWTGSTSTDYDTGSNWDIGAVPDAYTNVVIPQATERAILGQTTSAASLTVDNGGILDLNGNNVSLNDTSTVKNYGTVISQNDESSTNLDTSNGTVMYDNTTNKTGLVFGNAYNNLTFNDGLTGYWKFDEGSGTTALDSSGYGNNGVIANASYSTSLPPTKYANSSSLDFNGSTSSVSVPSFPSAASNITISAWVNPSSLDQPSTGGGVGGTIIDADEDGNSDGYDLGIQNTGKIWWWPASSQDIFSSGTVPLNTWTHIAITAEGGTVKMYINGVLDSTQTTAAAQVPTFMKIGAQSHVTGAWDGELDDVRIYDRALSGTEIAQLAAGNEPATSVATTTLNHALTVDGSQSLNGSLAGYWNLDETGGSTVADSSGNDNTGTISGTTATTPPAAVRFSDPSARSFNGTTDKITIPSPSSSLNLTGAMTISAWIDPTGWGGGSRGHIFDRNQNGDGYLLALDNLNTTGGLIFAINNTTAGLHTDWLDSSANAITLNQWQHVAITWDGQSGGTVTFYVNGKPAGSGTLSQTVNGATMAAVIGGRAADTARGFPGGIDDVRVYSRVLSPAEIAALADGNTGMPGNLTLNGGTLDVSGSNYNLTVGGAFENNGGVFAPEQGTVTLDGSGQSINSSNSFYNLSKTVSTADTLTFGQGSTTTVNGALGLSGASGNLLSLASSTPGTQWKLDPAGTANLSYVSVQDGDNLSGTALDPAHSTDSGGNTEWFDTTPPSTPSASPTGGDYNSAQSVSLSATDEAGGSGLAGIYYTTDGSTPTSSSTPYSGTLSVTSSELVKAIAYDNAGNASNVMSDSYIIDATPPTTPGTPSATTGSSDNTPGWSWTASTDSGGSGLKNPAYTVEWSQTSDFSSGVSSDTTNTGSYTNTASLADGEWYFRVKATDNAGNDSAWSATGSVYIDTTVLTGGGAVTGEAGTSTPITDVQVTSAESNPNVSVKLFVNDGTISLSTTAGLTFYNATGSTLSGQPGDTADLQFSGSLDDVNAALASLHYTRTSGTGTDTLSASLVQPGEVFFSGNDHLYEYFPGPVTWFQAKTDAAASSKYGAQGYLATITSQAENDFIQDRLQSDSWIGASDDVSQGTSEGNWIWTTGPEAGEQFWQGNGSGSIVNGMYAHWNNPTTGGTGAEPNNSGGDENCAEFYYANDGLWNDLNCDSTLGYIVEYGAPGNLPTVSSENIGITTSDTTPPSTPGTPTTTSPTNNNTPTFSWTASSDSGSGLANPAYSVEWSQDPAFSGLGGDDTVNGTSYTIPSGLNLSDGTWYFRVKATDNSGNSSAWSPAGSVEVDTAAPTFSGIASASTSNTSETISWQTNTTASSKVTYGPTGSYGSTTAETDTSPRVTSHIVTLSGLVACTLYHFAVDSVDALGNAGSSADNSFITSGCAGSADVTSHNDTEVTPTSGGSVSLNTVSVSVPASFAATAADFQIKQLDPTSSLNATGTPSGVSLAGNNVYDIEAMQDTTTKLDSFAHAISVTMDYTEAEISGLIETSLQIYRWDAGTGWQALDDCTVNTSAHTVTCTTSGFSTFALFGEAQPTSGSPDTSSSNTTTNPVASTLLKTLAAANPSTQTTTGTPEATSPTQPGKLPAVTFQPSDDKKAGGSTKSGAFLGLGWWWLLILAGAVLWWLVAKRRKRKRDD